MNIYIYIYIYMYRVKGRACHGLADDGAPVARVWPDGVGQRLQQSRRVPALRLNVK